ncbi:hypothetical protein L3Q82_001604 [Scortum barcoo]|uniref:Uncharacterized protein n=1 Tax=Scortum barcoo TaxID=214431 RepID=A0ACB8W859_9TELE|nr:hypothetical protein L3Q82_001604 [Scortum barcoo]
MAEGLPETSTSADLRFLVHMDKLRRYPTFLKEKGYMPTTIKNMMINVTQLYKHIDHSFQQCSRLTGADINRVVYEVKRLKAEVYRDVVVHHQKVRRRKSRNQLDSGPRTGFPGRCKEESPAAFPRPVHQQHRRHHHHHPK